MQYTAAQNSKKHKIVPTVVLRIFSHNRSGQGIAKTMPTKIMSQ